MDRVVKNAESDDIIDKLEQLAVQAVKEKSHYYVAKCVREAVVEIKRLREYEYMYKELSK